MHARGADVADACVFDPWLFRFPSIHPPWQQARLSVWVAQGNASNFGSRLFDAFVVVVSKTGSNSQAMHASICLYAFGGGICPVYHVERVVPSPFSCLLEQIVGVERRDRSSRPAAASFSRLKEKA